MTSITTHSIHKKFKNILRAEQFLLESAPLVSHYSDNVIFKFLYKKSLERQDLHSSNDPLFWLSFTLKFHET